MPSSADFGAVGELAAASHGVVTRQQAAQLGLTRHSIDALVARGLLLKPAPGVLVVRGAPPTWEQTLRIATLSGGPSSLAVIESAARLHGVDGFERADIARVS